MLIFQRLSALEHVVDAGVGLLVLCKVEECLFFQAQQVFLRHPLRQREIATCESAGDVGGDDAVVRGGVAAPLHGLDGYLERGLGGLARGVDVPSALRRGVAVREVEDLASGGGEEMVGVHHYPVIFFEEAHLSCLERARRGLRQRYGLEGYLQEWERGRVRGGAQRRGDYPARGLLR